MLCPECGSEAAVDAELCATCGCVLRETGPDSDVPEVSAVWQEDVGTVWEDDPRYDQEALSPDLPPQGVPADMLDLGLWEQDDSQRDEWRDDALPEDGAPRTEGRSPVDANQGDDEPGQAPQEHAHRRLRGSHVVAGLVGAALAVTVIMGGMGLLNEGGGDDTGPGGVVAAGTRVAAQPSRNARAKSAGAGGAGVPVPDGWDSRHIDAYGNPTAFALTELTGHELSELIQQLGFGWSEEKQAWSTGHALLYVFGGTQGYLNAEGLAALEDGPARAYQLAMSDYATVEEAYEALVLQAMTVEDCEFAGTTGFGVVYGPSMVEYLVEATQGDGYVSILTCGPAAVSEGLFDELAGGSYGSTPEEVFTTVTGRVPGE